MIVRYEWANLDGVVIDVWTNHEPNIEEDAWALNLDGSVTFVVDKRNPVIQYPDGRPWCEDSEYRIMREDEEDDWTIFDLNMEYEAGPFKALEDAIMYFKKHELKMPEGNDVGRVSFSM